MVLDDNLVKHVPVGTTAISSQVSNKPQSDNKAAPSTVKNKASNSGNGFVLAKDIYENSVQTANKKVPDDAVDDKGNWISDFILSTTELETIDVKVKNDEFRELGIKAKPEKLFDRDSDEDMFDQNLDEDMFDHLPAVSNINPKVLEVDNSDGKFRCDFRTALQMRQDSEVENPDPSSSKNSSQIHKSKSILDAMSGCEFRTALEMRQDKEAERSKSSISKDGSKKRKTESASGIAAKNNKKQKIGNDSSDRINNGMKITQFFNPHSTPKKDEISEESTRLFVPVNSKRNDSIVHDTGKISSTSEITPVEKKNVETIASTVSSSDEIAAAESEIKSQSSEAKETQKKILPSPKKTAGPSKPVSKSNDRSSHDMTTRSGTRNKNLAPDVTNSPAKNKPKLYMKKSVNTLPLIKSVLQAYYKSKYVPDKEVFKTIAKSVYQSLEEFRAYGKFCIELSCSSDVMNTFFSTKNGLRSVPKTNRFINIGDECTFSVYQ